MFCTRHTHTERESEIVRALDRSNRNELLEFCFCICCMFEKLFILVCRVDTFTFYIMWCSFLCVSVYLCDRKSGRAIPTKFQNMRGHAPASWKKTFKVHLKKIAWFFVWFFFAFIYRVESAQTNFMVR